MRAIPLLLVGLLFVPAGVRAEDCREEHESCVESCRIDLGLSKEKEKLARCVKRCSTAFEDCRDLAEEERVNQARAKEKAPPEKQYLPPADVKPLDETDGTTVRKDPEPSETRREKKGYQFESVDDTPVPAPSTDEQDGAGKRKGGRAKRP